MTVLAWLHLNGNGVAPDAAGNVEIPAATGGSGAGAKYGGGGGGSRWANTLAQELSAVFA